LCHSHLEMKAYVENPHRSLYAPSYGEYFGLKIFAIGLAVLEKIDQFGTGYPTTHMHIALHYSNSHQMAPPAIHADRQ